MKPVTSRTRADPDFDGSSTQHGAVRWFQREDDLNWSTIESSNTRTEAVELQQRRHPLRTSCARPHKMTCSQHSDIDYRRRASWNVGKFDLDIWPCDLKTSTVRFLSTLSICFGSSPSRGSRAIEMPTFSWSSLHDLDLWSHDLDNIISSSPKRSEYLCEALVHIPSSIQDLSSSRDFHVRRSLTLTFDPMTLKI